MATLSLSAIEQELDTAIGQQETGNGTAGVGLSLNNPGALKFASWETDYGATQASSGFAQFPTLAQGQSALAKLVDNYVQSGSSLSSLIANWAPASDGNTNNAARVSQLASLTGLDPSQSIQSQAQSSGSLFDLGSFASGVAASYGAGTSTQAAVSQAANVGAFTWMRITAFGVGFICIVVGLVALKDPASTVVENVIPAPVRNTAKKIGSVAADAAVAA